MDNYRNAGFYLIKRQPLGFGKEEGKLVSTCSTCINLSAIGPWAVSARNLQLTDEQLDQLGLDQDKLAMLRSWLHGVLKTSEFSFMDVFPTLDMALECKQQFFALLPEVDLYTIDYSPTDAAKLLQDFAPGINEEFNFNDGEFDIRNYLERGLEPADGEKFEDIGFDLIGVDGDGKFHSFYCHDMTHDLKEKFGLTINDEGLFTDIPDMDAVRGYLNGPEAAVEPVPWYIVRVQRWRQ